MLCGPPPDLEVNQAEQPLSSAAGMNLMDTKLALTRDKSMEITGKDRQILTVTLEADEEILVQPGCLIWCDEGLQSEVSAGGCSNFCTRFCCLGQSGFRVHWKNETDGPQRIGLSPSHPAKVVAIPLESHSGELFIKGGSFMASTDPDLEFNIERAGRGSGGTIGKGVFGGQGFVLTKVTGRGWVFINGSGCIFERRLAEGETLVVDQACVLCWETTVRFDYRRAGGMGMMCCGGEGLTNTILTGPGYVAIQSMPFEKVRMMLAKGDSNQNPVAVLVFLFVFVMFIVLWICVAVVVASASQDAGYRG